MKKTILILSIIMISAFALASECKALDPTVTITPNPLEFDDVSPGGSSGPETLTVAKTDSTSILINSIAISDTTNFRITSDECTGQQINNQKSCQVQIAFEPTQGIGGYFSGFGVFGSGEEPLAVSSLQGQAVAPQVTLMPTSVDFGNQTVGNSSAARDVTLENSGNAVLNITNIVASTDFTVTDDCGASLAAGNKCTISTTFTPPATGNFTGTVTITSDAQTSPDTVALSGTGVAAGQPDASLSTGSLDFGGQVVNTTSAAQTVVLTNTGTVGLAVNSITPPAGFATTDNCGSSLAPSVGCNIDTTFGPTAAQNYTGNLTIDTDAADSPHLVALQGIGVESTGPLASLSQTSLDFGEQKLRTPSDPLTTTITNEGDENLMIESIQKTADNSGSFSGTEDCSGKSISPGGTCNINAIFNPQQKGTLAATADIISNSPNSPQQLTATGIGVRVSGGGCQVAGRGVASSRYLLLPLLLAISYFGVIRKRQR